MTKDLKSEIDKVTAHIVKVERDLQLLKIKPPSCELSTYKLLKDHTNQLAYIQQRLKPYKKAPPAVFKKAMQVFAQGVIGDLGDHLKVGNDSPRGKKLGTLWDVEGEETGAQSPSGASATRNSPLSTNKTQTFDNRGPDVELDQGIKLHQPPKASLSSNQNRWMGHDQITVATAPKLPAGNQ